MRKVKNRSFYFITENPSLNFWKNYISPRAVCHPHIMDNKLEMVAVLDNTLVLSSYM